MSDEDAYVPSPATPMSERRARKLKWALWAVLATALIMAAAGVLLLLYARRVEDAREEQVYTLFAIFMLAPSALMMLASSISLRFVPFRGRGAKAGGGTTGVLTMLVGVPFVQGLIGLPLLALGATTLFLAVWPEKRNL